MDRRSFLIKGCGGCLGMGAMLTVMHGCTVSGMVSGTIEGSDMIVHLNDFEKKKGAIKEFKEYLVVQHERLQYPICVYRIDENNYKALLMKCTHQGTELQVFGEKLQCPAHGSEFNRKGDVENGPANTSLRTFPVTVGNGALKISLK